METTGQTMGLTETLNGLNATSEENGIDLHMMLPTEYGAVAILSASGYGNPGKLLDEADAQKRTTTGNSTGVYFTGDRWEWMASNTKVQESKYNKPVATTGSILCPNCTVGWHGGGKLEARVVNTYCCSHSIGSLSSWCFGGSGIHSIGWATDANKPNNGGGGYSWDYGYTLGRGACSIVQ